MELIYDEDIRARTVIDSEGRVVGEVAGLLIDSHAWRVRSVRVKLYKEVADIIGEPRGTFRAALIDVPVEAVTGVGDTVVLARPIGSARRAALRAPQMARV